MLMWMAKLKPQITGKYSEKRKKIHYKPKEYFGTRKVEVLNSLIINTTAKANDTTDILQTFR